MDIPSFTNFQKHFIKRTSLLRLLVDFYERKEETQSIRCGSCKHMISRSNNNKSNVLLVHDVAEEQD